MINHFDIFSISNQKQFQKLALKIFRYQYDSNRVYREFCELLKIEKQSVKSVAAIPFLPIQFFKSHTILVDDCASETKFISSGTTGNTSTHYVADLSVYEQSYSLGFAQTYGNIENYVVLALLPSYLEREGSSLIYMVDDLIKKSIHADSGYYLNNLDELSEKLIALDKSGQDVLLIGVTYALLDLIEAKSFSLKNTIIMETGGMKGRRKEIIREDLHERLCEGFGVSKIHSEYGMTELLSQAYSTGDGLFECPPWMQIIVRDPEDALATVGTGKTGGINIIDLANIYSCSFIATQDLGKVYDAGKFEVLGRFDNSDIRGCNLMVY